MSDVCCTNCGEPRGGWFPGLWPNWFPSECPNGGKHDWQWGEPQAKGEAGLRKIETAIGLAEKRQELLAKKVLEEKMKAKEMHTAGNKSKALSHLKKSKGLQGEHDRLQVQIDNMQQSAMAIEKAQMDVTVIKATEDAGKTLKDTIKGADADKVMDDVQQALEDADDIANAISQPMDALNNDEDLEDEYAALMAEGAAGQGEKQQEAKKAVKKPAKSAQEAEAEEEAELAQLMAA